MPRGYHYPEAHELQKISNRGEFSDPLSRNNKTEYLTAESEETKRYLCATCTPCARRAAPYGANVENGAKNASS